MSVQRLATFHPLSPAEEGLISCLGKGIFHQCGDGRLPADGDASRRVRAELLRLFLIGGDDIPPTHEKGVLLSGALIVGMLDLESCRIPRDLRLADCRFDSPLMLRSAVIDTLLLDGSVIPGMIANRLNARGCVYMRAVTINGELDMLGARLGGDLMLDGSSIIQVRGLAFNGSHISMRGDMTMRGTRMRGAVRISGAHLQGDLLMTGADLQHEGGPALDAAGVKVQGTVSLSAARIVGEANLIGARVTGDIHLDGGTFIAPNALALTLNRAVIEGAIFLRNGAKVQGGLSLNGTQVGLIVDEKESWPAAGDLLLNRFTYNGFLASPVDAASRLEWLSRQDPARWGEDFWPQPYEQLSEVLSRMGHREAARTVQFERERLQRQLRKARAKSAWKRALYTVSDGLLWATVGYGLQPLLAFFWMILLWLIGVGLLAAIQATGQLRPNIPIFLRSPEWVLCGAPPSQTILMPSLNQARPGMAAPGQTQIDCYLSQPEVATYPKFNKWMYSLETMVPGLERGQRNYWSPDTRFALGYIGKAFEYVQIVIGFALGLLAFAGFSGIVKSR